MQKYKLKHWKLIDYYLSHPRHLHFRSELFGRTLKVNHAKASTTAGGKNRAIWEDEDWLRRHTDATEESQMGTIKVG